MLQVKLVFTLILIKPRRILNFLCLLALEDKGNSESTITKNCNLKSNLTYNIYIGKYLKLQYAVITPEKNHDLLKQGDARNRWVMMTF